MVIQSVGYCLRSSLPIDPGWFAGPFPDAGPRCRHPELVEGVVEYSRCKHSGQPRENVMEPLPNLNQARNAPANTVQYG